ncbi:MAG TPA: hypothetical protein VFC74_05920 [Oscillospiraceae bacterium]|nr:hypothetical protein [Oscillospiraceae bacterium]
MNVTILILRIILLILGGSTAACAVARVSGESGISFSTLWEQLPDRYK